METTRAVKHGVVHSPPVHLTHHLPCVHCGYDLFGVAPIGRCPECGTLVATSLAEPRAAFSRSQIFRVRVALAAHACACTMPILVPTIGLAAMIEGIVDLALGRLLLITLILWAAAMLVAAFGFASVKERFPPKIGQLVPLLVLLQILAACALLGLLAFIPGPIESFATVVAATSIVMAATIDRTRRIRLILAELAAFSGRDLLARDLGQSGFRIVGGITLCVLIAALCSLSATNAQTMGSGVIDVIAGCVIICLFPAGAINAMLVLLEGSQAIAILLASRRWIPRFASEEE